MDDKTNSHVNQSGTFSKAYIMSLRCTMGAQPCGYPARGGSRSLWFGFHRLKMKVDCAPPFTNDHTTVGRVSEIAHHPHRQTYITAMSKAIAATASRFQVKISRLSIRVHRSDDPKPTLSRCGKQHLRNMFAGRLPD